MSVFGRSFGKIKVKVGEATMNESSKESASSNPKESQPSGKRYSRREVLLMIGVTLGTSALCEFIQAWLTIFPPEKIREYISVGTLRVDDFSVEQKRFFRREIIDRICTKPTAEEIDSAYIFFNQTTSKLKEQSQNVFSHTVKTPGGLEGKCAGAVNPEKIKAGEIVWFLEGTPPGPFTPSKVEKEGTLSVPGTLAKISLPSILLGEPNQAGFDSDSPDFAGNSLQLMLGKGLAAVGLWQLLSRGELDVEIPPGRCLELGGYSGGANAALVMASHFPENIKRLFTFSGCYDLFQPYFEERAQAALEGRETFQRLSLWIGELFFQQAIQATKSNDSILQETFIKDYVEPLRQTMLRASPYYWAQRIPPNSFVWELAHGTKDQFMPFTQTEQLVTKLVSLGWDKDHLRVFFHNGDHFSVGKGV